ncbi:PilZ domain-containing protein [Neptunomonas sp.]|uniref:PilZ domain-containing protein n=1 Tax=Neptunomonas sp. TaxID=1971898 RepID=UPI0025F629FE|nr:PilZ domain-containing protein [Neptunomonas sp.]
MKPVIEIDTDDSQRRTYRVRPHPDDPVSLSVAGVAVEIIDISAKGVAFRYQGEASKEAYPMRLTFETDKEYEITCYLKINRRSNPEYSAEYIDIDEKDVARITGLIIECQKRDIRRNKLLETQSRERTEK